MSGSIDVAGSRIEVLEQGAGQPVVLLHSSMGSSLQWRSLADALSARYRVLAPDFYGYGASAPWPGGAAFTLAHEAEIVHALIARAGEPVHLVGHSYGGAVALRVARLRSARLRSLALIEPVAFHLLGERAEAVDVAEAVAHAVVSGDHHGGARIFVDYWSGAGAWESLPPARRAAMAARLGKVALDFHAVLGEPGRLHDFRGIAVPTLLVQGERSPAPTREICRLLARTMPAAGLATVAGAGHMAPLTHRDEVNALVAAHLDRHFVHRAAA